VHCQHVVLEAALVHRIAIARVVCVLHGPFVEGESHAGHVAAVCELQYLCCGVGDADHSLCFGTI